MILFTIMICWGENMKPLKKSVSITLDEDILLKAKELAEASDRSLSQYINLVLRKHISIKENKLKTDEGDEKA